ncbi:hypothetical protein F4804DRAFT_16867 [Jackrogersella minutella]|nr:hypothetical protein F4804DRAFT_16867 [Jackrogersella minutella]
MLRTDELLLKARERVSKTSYRIVNQETGCYGVAERDTPASRPNITIHHNIKCGCLDVRMRHLRKHANVTWKRKGIRKARRDDLIIAIKLRLPNVGIRTKMRQSNTPMNPEDVDEEPIRVVEDMPGGQLLIEMWDTVEAWMNRRIWKDW